MVRNSRYQREADCQSAASAQRAPATCPTYFQQHRVSELIGEKAVRYVFGRAGQKDAVIKTYLKGTGGGQNRHRTLGESAHHCCHRRAGRPCTGTVGFARTPFPEADINRVTIDLTDEGNVGAIRETRVALDSRARGAPVEIEILHRDGALR